MSPNFPAPAHAHSIPPSEMLAALQNAFAQFPPPIEHPPTAGPERLPLRESFLNLRDVAQIPFEVARAAFTMTDPAYPEDWKEQIRQLRNRLNLAQSELEDPADLLQVVAFTNMFGSRPRYGTAPNLALTMSAIQDTRVLLIDANLTTPTLHMALGVPAGPGLAEATRADRLALPACFRRITGTQVYLLTVGDLDVFPGEPLDIAGLHSFLQSLRQQFDWIILDGPGFDTTADTVAITLAADGVIMMIESEYDSFRNVAKALGQVPGRRMLGAVMF